MHEIAIPLIRRTSRFMRHQRSTFMKFTLPPPLAFGGDA